MKLLQLQGLAATASAHRGAPGQTKRLARPWPLLKVAGHRPGSTPRHTGTLDRRAPPAQTHDDKSVIRGLVTWSWGVPMRLSVWRRSPKR